MVEGPQDTEGPPLSARVPAVELVDVAVQTEPLTFSGVQAAASSSALPVGEPACARCEYLYQRLEAALGALTSMEQRIRRMAHAARPVTPSALAEVADDVTETLARRNAALGELRRQLEAWNLGTRMRRLREGYANFACAQANSSARDSKNLCIV